MYSTQDQPELVMRRFLAYAYGVVSYLIFFASFLYLIGFVANVGVPKSLDVGSGGGVFVVSLLVNVGLIALFGLQHSVMARPGFKEWWTRVVPDAIERSTYVLLASLALIAVMVFWRPMTGAIWTVEAEAGRIALWSVQALGWGLVLYTTFLISHFHLFGLQQVHKFWIDEDLTHPEFQTPGLYEHVRHPMMLGFFLAFWATPDMTIGHLVFALGMTGYVLIALQYEERDLLATFGEKYRAYRRRVPMLIPGSGRTDTAQPDVRREVSRG